MIVLDAYAVLAYLKAEPAADAVRPLLKAREGLLTSLGVAEVLDHLVRVMGVEEDEAMLDLTQLDLADPLPIGPADAATAGLLRARHYHRKSCAVSLADCVAAQCARSLGAALATSDPHLLDVCASEEIATLVLPGSDGSVWSPPT